MNILQIVIMIFVVIECLNIMILYGKPSSKIGNGVGVFNDYDQFKDDAFVRYLINWVAGTKLIFIMLGIVIVIFGDEKVQLYSVIALILSILSFYFRLFPIIKTLDQKGKITPKGYAKTLNMMIIGFLMMFAVALGIYFIV